MNSPTENRRDPISPASTSDSNNLSIPEKDSSLSPIFTDNSNLPPKNDKVSSSIDDQGPFYVSLEEPKFSIASIEQLEALRQTKEDFYLRFKLELEKSKSFLITTLIVDNELCIYVGAENHLELKIPNFFENVRIYLHENSVVLAHKSFQSSFKPKLEVGCIISRQNDDKIYNGTIGGFFKISNDNNDYAMTCSHVVGNNESTDVFQPMLDAIYRANADPCKYNAAITAKFNVFNVIDISIIDYSLIKVTDRALNQKKNSFIEAEGVNELKEYELKEYQYDLNDPQQALILFKDKTIFNKKGGTTDFTSGLLVSPERIDNILKIRLNSSTDVNRHYREFAFKNDSLSEDLRFADCGDSGSTIFSENSSIIGLIFACTNNSPYLSFATPITTIYNNFKDNFKQDLRLSN